jgi:hypothetical protein
MNFEILSYSKGTSATTGADTIALAKEGQEKEGKISRRNINAALKHLLFIQYCRMFWYMKL